MLHLPHLVHDLGIILAVAAVVTMIFKLIRQPVVLGYLIAGFLVGPQFEFIPTITEDATIRVWAEIGVIFLLFGLGLEFSFKKLRTVGGTASITGVVEVSFMLIAGYLTGKLLGWGQIDSLFLGGILAISSTTIILRTFDELEVKTKHFAQVVMGILIVEDLAAILLLVLLSTISVTQQFEGSELLYSSLKLFFFLCLWFVGGIFLIPSILRRVKDHLNDEYLLILSVGLCLMMVIFATQVGFSPALGAFIMGSILAETSEGHRVEHLITPMRNFFGAIFFVSVGMLIDPKMLLEHWPSALVLTVVLICGKIFSATLGSLVAGQSLKNSFQTGFSLAQIGEFSFIIATLGLSLKVTSGFLYPLAVVVSVVTTFTTPYLVKLSGPLADYLEDRLPSRLTNIIRRYSSSTQEISVSSSAQEELKKSIFKFILLSVIIVAVTLLARNYTFPFLKAYFGSRKLAASVTFGISFIFSAPFYWSLYRAESSFVPKVQGRLNFLSIALNFLRLLLCLALFIFQFTVFLPGPYAVIIILIAAALGYRKFPHHLSGVSQWLEGNFVRNLQGGQAIPAKRFHLLPWEAHMASYEIPQNAVYLGMTLESLKVREKFGVSVVLIERGMSIIKAPSKDERLFPFDKLSVIGDDDQLLRFKEFVDSTEETNAELTTTDYGLKGCLLLDSSEFVGKTIRDCGIREAVDGLVVGLERGDKRLLNPHTNMKLEAGDLLWIVGDKEKMKELF